MNVEYHYLITYAFQIVILLGSFFVSAYSGFMFYKKLSVIIVLF